MMTWPGCENARDLGGLPTAWGGRIRTGALVRADRLRPGTVRTVLVHGVRLVVDLRLKAECEADPSPMAGRPGYLNLSVLRPEDDVLEAMAPTLTQIYRAILERGPDRLAGVLAAMTQAPPGGVLVHCHSGKDRTGLVVALALAVAGVDDELIAADYAASATRLGRPPADTSLSHRLFAEVTAETMRRTLSWLREEYGGAEPYLLEGGLTATHLTRLRARLTTTR